MKHARGSAGWGAAAATALTAAAAAQVTSFTSQSEFETYMQGQGHTLLGSEDFEDFNLPEFQWWEGDAVSLADTGLITPGLVPSANWGNLLTPQITRGPDIVNINGPITIFGLPSTTLVTDRTPVDAEGSTDLHFGTLSVVNDVATMNYQGVTGFGLRLYCVGSEGTVNNNLVLRVFGEDGQTFLGEFFGVASSAVTGSFFGVASTTPIGRVNLHDGISEQEIVDDIQMWGAASGCAADLDDSGDVDVFDLLAYLDLWFVGDAEAELTGDNPASVDVFDLLAYLDLWFAGC